jgi:hypothetical protein
MICGLFNLVCGVVNLFVCDPTVNHVIGALNLIAAGYFGGVWIMERQPT